VHGAWDCAAMRASSALVMGDAMGAQHARAPRVRFCHRERPAVLSGANAWVHHCGTADGRAAAGVRHEPAVPQFADGSVGATESGTAAGAALAVDPRFTVAAVASGRRSIRRVGRAFRRRVCDGLPGSVEGGVGGCRVFPGENRQNEETAGSASLASPAASSNRNERSRIPSLRRARSRSGCRRSRSRIGPPPDRSNSP
jgi:hypothetical protein